MLLYKKYVSMIKKIYNENDDDDYKLVVTFGCFADDNEENVFKSNSDKLKNNSVHSA